MTVFQITCVGTILAAIGLVVALYLYMDGGAERP